jgi:hypothetical protein
VAPRRIGELLVAEGLLTEGAVQRALGYQRLSGDRIKLGSILLNWDLLGEEALLATLAKLHGCPAVTAQMLFDTPMETVRLLPAAQAIRIGAIPWAAEKGIVRVAFANPSNLAAIDEVAALTRRRIVPGVTTEARLFQAHQKYYGRHVPLEYRPILQKLDRRTTTTTKVGRDFRASDLVQSERESGGYTPSTPSVNVPIHPGEEPSVLDSSSQPRESQDFTLEFPRVPDFPTPEAASSSSSSLASAMPSSADTLEGPSSDSEDSLSDWVGGALSSFSGAGAGDRPDPRGNDPDSPAGVSDPALFGREGSTLSDSADPGSLHTFEDLPATNALRDRPSRAVRRQTPAAPGRDSVPSELHSRGIPASIPPFRRATDPEVFARSFDPLDAADEVAAGMWQPAPGGSESEDEIESEASVQAQAPAAVSLEPSGSAGARRREEIADSVLRGALEALPRVLLLATGKSGVTGWRGRGPALTADAVSAIRIPTSEISVFSSVQQSGVPHFGAIDRAEWPQALAAVLGPAPPDCAIFPIRILDGVAAFLYADRLGAPMQYEDFAVVARAAASAANVLSRFLLRADRSGSPVRS